MDLESTEELRRAERALLGDRAWCVELTTEDWREKARWPWCCVDLTGFRLGSGFFFLICGTWKGREMIYGNAESLVMEWYPVEEDEHRLINIELSGCRYKNKRKCVGLSLPPPLSLSVRGVCVCVCVCVCVYACMKWKCIWHIQFWDIFKHDGTSSMVFILAKAIMQWHMHNWDITPRAKLSAISRSIPQLSSALLKVTQVILRVKLC